MFPDCVTASPASPRVASLVPSLTELLFALGLGPWVVARTGYCIHPAAQVATVPKVGGTKTVNLAKLRRLAPSHVVVNIDENRRADVDALRSFVPQVVVTHPLTPHDNLALIDQVLDALDAPAPARARGAALKADLSAELDRLAGQAWPVRRVLYLIWRDPWMTVARDTYISAMLARVGWQTWPEVHGGPSGAARYPVVQGDEPWLAGVQEVLLSSEPYAFGAADLGAAQALAPNARVRLVDGELLSWYGPRAADGLRLLGLLARQARGQPG